MNCGASVLTLLFCVLGANSSHFKPDSGHHFNDSIFLPVMELIAQMLFFPVCALLLLQSLLNLDVEGNTVHSYNKEYS